MYSTLETSEDANRLNYGEIIYIEENDMNCVKVISVLFTFPVEPCF